MNEEPSETYAKLSRRLTRLEAKTELLGSDQQEELNVLRQWQVDHEKKSDRIISSQDELIALVEAMRWAGITRSVILWVSGAVVALATAWNWLHGPLGHIFSHKG